jgi:hypothetical protein
MDELEAATAVRFDGGASCEVGTEVLVVDDVTIVVLELDPGPAVLLVDDDVDVVVTDTGVALAMLE